ncbi:MAG: PspC domain-containing protein [bacterium]
MKKTVTVNLGSTVFSIDEDGYALLKDYLERIENHFSDDEERKEIMSDIEARMAELFSGGNTTPVKPVTLEDVKKVIAIMGDPEDIADMAEESDREGEYSEKREYDGSAYSGKTRRRIYRDIDNRMLGGVCSGMAAYWSVDVIWIRIIFVVLALLFFSGFLVYLLLWIVIPPARTVAQKLEMRGEPVTISSIRKAVKEEFNNVRRNLKI